MSDSLIQNLKFDEQGLITAVVQDDATSEVLMVAYMNAESLAQTLRSGQTWFSPTSSLPSWTVPKQSHVSVRWREEGT